MMTNPDLCLCRPINMIEDVIVLQRDLFRAEIVNKAESETSELLIHF